MGEATTLARPWAGLDWDAKVPFVAWIARQAGVDLAALNGSEDSESETAEYAVLTFIEEIVKATGGSEDQVKALTEWLVGQPVLLRFVVNEYRESEIVNRNDISGGILDQKLAEADALISALWRYIP